MCPQARHELRDRKLQALSPTWFSVLGAASPQPCPCFRTASSVGMIRSYKFEGTTSGPLHFPVNPLTTSWFLPGFEVCSCFYFLDKFWHFLLSGKLSGLGEILLRAARAVCSHTWCPVKSLSVCQIGAHHPFPPDGSRPRPLAPFLRGRWLASACSRPSWQCGGLCSGT